MFRQPKPVCTCAHSSMKHRASHLIMGYGYTSRPCQVKGCECSDFKLDKEATAAVRKAASDAFKARWNAAGKKGA